MTRKIYKVANTYINIENVSTLSRYNSGFNLWYLRVDGEDIPLDDDQDYKEANELMKVFINRR